MRHYDRDGLPITEQQWVRLRDDWEHYCRIGLTYLSEGIFVSTVWLGIDHSDDGHPPMIFETYVNGNGTHESEIQRYSTLREAYAGHRTTLERWREILEPKVSTCRYQSDQPPGTVKHGKIVAKGRSLLRNEDFDICDLHLAAYQNSGTDFHVRLNYERDISSNKAVARRQQYAWGIREFQRSELLDSRKDLL